MEITLNDKSFLQNFNFNEFYFDKTTHRDNSHGIPLHYIGFMKKGKGILSYNGGKLTLNENDMFYIPKSLKYYSCWIADPTVKFDSIGFLYFPSHSKNGYSLQKINYDENLFNLFKPLSLSKEVNTESIGCLYSLLGKLEHVLVEAPISRTENIVENFISLLEQNPQKLIPEYAYACGVSEPLLYLHVKKVLGKTPNQLRQEIQCKKAIDYLTATSLSIEQICDKVGFSSSSYFRKILYSITGKTPTQIRKQSLSI